MHVSLCMWILAILWGFYYELWDFTSYFSWNKGTVVTFFQMRKIKTGEGWEHQGWDRSEIRIQFSSLSLHRVRCLKWTVLSLLSSLSLWSELMLPAQRAQQLGAANAAATALLPWAIQWYTLYFQLFENLWQLVIDFTWKGMVCQNSLLIFVRISVGQTFKLE